MERGPLSLVSRIKELKKIAAPVLKTKIVAAGDPPR
jgi:hypothetical protein